ncbi:Tfx family DNA-binding protein [Haloferax namakaokahaiae]|uniref:Tfx family DNA-binding protein n=1 Tax=Haloferax namakaokahaiae TaxID=1748331 RepID=A0ABD5ZD11_9EURY
MVSTDATVLTERQVEVLELREKGFTQREVAERLGTTDSNVSAVERAAAENIEKARQTLELVRMLKSPVRFTIEAGTSFDTLVDTVYDYGDETGTKIQYCRPELYTHLFGVLRSETTQNKLDRDVEVGLSNDGEVEVHVDGIE